MFANALQARLKNGVRERVNYMAFQKVTNFLEGTETSVFEAHAAKASYRLAVRAFAL